MKKRNVLFLRCILIAITGLVAASCAGSPSRRQAPDFSGLLDRDWYLSEIRGDNERVILDRSALEAGGLGDAFTLRFDENRISGKALPNRYFGPYTRGQGQAITFEAAAATLMASFIELEALTEQEYFRYLEGIQSWNLVQGRLELRAVTGGTELVLVFTAP
jgi:hypothetical protein